MTPHQQRVEATKNGLFRYLRKHGGCNTTLEALAEWHLRMGGRAPGETPHRCETCGNAWDETPAMCYACKVTAYDNWRPKGGAR